MNREIEFRGKLPPIKGIFSKNWVYGNLLLWKDGTAEICTETNSVSMDKFTVIPETVGQYTGLKDKNGVKIFEGDIVTLSGNKVPAEIIFKGGCFCFSWSNAKVNERVINLIIPMQDTPDGAANIFTVIGNVHDNRELLEGASNDR